MKAKTSSLLFPLLLVLYEIATYLSNDMYLPALPQMMVDFGLNTQQAQFTLTAWFMGAACMPLMIGGISDRFGRRSVLLMGGVIYVIASVVCATTYDSTCLLISRIIQGAMIPTMIIPGYACIHESYEQKDAIKMLALMGSISVLAPAFGPLLGSLVLTIANWRGIFWVIAVWAAVAILLLYKWMPETVQSEQRPSLSITNLLKQYYRVVTTKQFILLMGSLGCIFCGFLAWISAGPLLVMITFHYSAIAYGLIQVFVFAAYLLGSRQVKYLLEYFTPEKLIFIGLSIALTGSFLLLLTAWLIPSSLYPFIVAMMIFSFGSALCFAPLNRAVIDASTEPMGIRMALVAVFIQIAAVTGSGMSSLFFNGSLISLAIIISMAVILACFLKAILYQHTRPSRVQ